MHVAATALLFWDYFLTFDQEIEFFWHGEWSWPRVLFFLNRYFPLLVQTINTAALTDPTISDEFCRVYLLGLFPASAFASIFVVQSIVCFRIYSMYGRSKMVLIPLVVLLLCCAVAAISITAFSSVNSVASAHGIPGIVLCGELSSVQIIYGAVVPLVIFEGIACILVLWKAYSHLIHSHTKLPFMSRLVAIIARDSIFYFVTGFIVYISNAMIWRFGSPTLGGLLIGVGVALLSVLGNRMLLNLRVADAESRTTTIETVPAIEFVPRNNIQPHSISFEDGRSAISEV